MSIRNLQINHLTTPIGINGSSLYISWTLENSIKQSAFCVQVVTDDNEIIFDSDYVATNRMNFTLPIELPHRLSARVIVKIKDENDVVCEASLPFTTGLSKSDWQAKWILPEEAINKKGNNPACVLRKKFEAQSVGKKAYLYITAHGIFTVKINGKNICDYKLMPGTQQYNKRLMVEAIDVSKFVREGENEITVTIGDGWYRGAMGYNQDRFVFGEYLALLAQLEIDDEVVLITDESWEASSNGPIRENDFMNGENYDARMEEIKDFHPVKIADYSLDNLINVDTAHILPHETFKGKYINTPNGEKVLDFGQNLVGAVSMNFEANAGQTVKLTHGETLDKDGNFTTSNFQNPRVITKQEINYICKDGQNSYEPSMTYMGFRYVKLEADFEIPEESFTATAIYSDMRTTASFECGNKDVNKLFENALWSMKGNFVDVPTDCPTREKSGYSGDCQAYIYTAMYLMDCYSVYAKWAREQAATQFDDGMVAQVAPTHLRWPKKNMTDGGIGWSDSIEIVPYKLAERYGDLTSIEENYDVIKKWMEYEINRAKKTRFSNRKLLPKDLRCHMIDKGWMWGEWLEPGMNQNKYMVDICMHGDPEVGTAYLYYGCKLTAEMAQKLGKTEDAAYFNEHAALAKKAYRTLCLEEGIIKEKNRQCRYVRPLFMGLLDDGEKQQAADTLAEMIKSNDGHLNTGFLTTHELTRSLSNNGHAKTAYDLLFNEDAPSWLYSVKKGCTTIPENWLCFDEEGNPKDSFNHYSYGAIVGWLMDTCAGIRVENGKIVIAPIPDERLGYVKATYDSPYGMIVSEWKYVDGKLQFSYDVPKNVEVEVRMPR